MDKINLISNILILSLEFDDLLEKNKFCDLEKCSEEIKLKINEYKSISHKNKKLNNLNSEISLILDKIQKINMYAIKHFSNLCKNENKKINVNESNNTMILFYDEKCKYSTIFFPEWKKLKNTLGNKVNMIAIDCRKIENRDICKFFKIYEYPTIKYVTPTKIHEYYGDMKYEEIMDTFLLN